MSSISLASHQTDAATDLASVSVIIPALNEEAALARLLPVLRPFDLGQVIVGDNGSTDATAQVARDAGAVVITEPRRGYGAACAAAMTALGPDCRVVAFLDGDMSDDPALLPAIVGPILGDRADLVIGCRDAAGRERGSMTAPQRFGNWLATRLMWLRWGYRYRDLGPFRAISRDALDRMGMRDRAYGWTVEMQARALQMGLRIEQISVPYRRRVGRSKISGTVRGVVLAGWYILTTLGRLAILPARDASRGPQRHE
ncbi:MAG: glycosyltransferase family 2 protein [Phycisphaerales bacterium]|nr:glycosyltransferase family 2 protein [Phycisphaerales bacterium]